MVRPVIQMNAWRKRKRHIMIFFIFLVSNIGGCLTPIGDPPLLMGFSRGVGFTWSLHLLPLFLLNAAVLLTVFYFIDRKAYHTDITLGYRPDISKAGVVARLRGAHNIIFMVMIVIAVILSGVLPKLPIFQNADGTTAGIHIFGEVTLTWTAIIECVIILMAAWASFKTTPKKIRRKNHFTWNAIEEVAVLFIGIFITMQPALVILREVSQSMNELSAFKMFWMTGSLSSCLDNTPTYLVFLTMAGAQGAAAGIQTSLGIVPQKVLMAVSAGAVFMGANTYIGNAPNFMVKSISDENGIRMPSFFGYIGWSLCILIPVFLLDSVLFFL
ncbi:MAG: sodium:proton antiporter, partial [Eubacteriales bacterium]|nr:sodium:proton antiporter [Eubacteriales bacterium]